MINGRNQGQKAENRRSIIDAVSVHVSTVPLCQMCENEPGMQRSEIPG